MITIRIINKQFNKDWLKLFSSCFVYLEPRELNKEFFTNYVNVSEDRWPFIFSFLSLIQMDASIKSADKEWASAFLME